MTACFGIVLAFLVSFSFPLWQLLLGPLVLGIPHVVGDVRYLVLHKRLHQKSWFWWCAVAPFVLYAITRSVHYAMLGVFFGIVEYTKTRCRAICRTNMCVLLLFGFATLATYFLFAFLHAHNVIAIGIWWFWSKNRKSWESIPLVLCGLGCIGLVLLENSDTLGLSYHPPYLDMEYYHQAIAYMAAESWQTTTVLLFAFSSICALFGLDSTDSRRSS